MTAGETGITSGALREQLRDLRIELRILNDSVAASVGIHPPDLDLLDIIDRDGPCTPSFVADRMGIPRATLTSVLTRLESAGWVRRQPNPNDSRSVLLAPTAEFASLGAAYGRVSRLQQALQETHTERELAVASAVLESVVLLLREDRHSPSGTEDSREDIL